MTVMRMMVGGGDGHWDGDDNDAGGAGDGSNE